MPRTLNFLAPSLHSNTLLDISYPEPGPSKRDPIVRHLAVRHGDHRPLGHIKRIVSTGPDQVVVADDEFRISTISLGSDEPSPPEVTTQHASQSRKGDIWAGLIPVQGGVISALTSGQLVLHPSITTEPAHERTVPSPLMALSSSGPSATTFALVGKEVDVSIWDVERTFSSSSSSSEGSPKNRKKDAREPGETWRAKNLPNNSLSLRPPIHHLCLAHLAGSDTSLVSGTKSGNIRRYDTRQRRPASDWKVAREGGVGCVVPGAEHELFFADRSSLVGALDLRTGRLLYSYSSMTCTAHHLFPVPLPDGGSSIGLASIACDATMRLHTTVPRLAEGVKGNAIGEGEKPKVIGMVGGIGVGIAIWRGWGKIPDEPALKEADRADGENGDDEDGEDGFWEGMSEVDDDDDESASEEDVEPTKRRKA